MVELIEKVKNDFKNMAPKTVEADCYESGYLDALQHVNDEITKTNHGQIFRPEDVKQMLSGKALSLIKKLRKASYNHAHYGTDMAIDEETAIELVEEVFDVEEPLN